MNQKPPSLAPKQASSSPSASLKTTSASSQNTSATLSSQEPKEKQPSSGAEYTDTPVRPSSSPPPGNIIGIYDDEDIEKLFNLTGGKRPLRRPWPTSPLVIINEGYDAGGVTITEWVDGSKLVHIEAQ